MNVDPYNENEEDPLVSRWLSAIDDDAAPLQEDSLIA